MSDLPRGPFTESDVVRVTHGWEAQTLLDQTRAWAKQAISETDRFFVVFEHPDGTGIYHAHHLPTVGDDLDATLSFLDEVIERAHEMKAATIAAVEADL